MSPSKSKLGLFVAADAVVQAPHPARMTEPDRTQLCMIAAFGVAALLVLSTYSWLGV